MILLIKKYVKSNYSVISEFFSDLKKEMGIKKASEQGKIVWQKNLYCRTSFGILKK